MPRRQKDQYQPKVEVTSAQRSKLGVASIQVSTGKYRGWIQAFLAVIIACLLFLLCYWVVGDSYTALKKKAEAAALAHDWNNALQYWKTINETTHAQAWSYLGEARARLALSQAARAETALRRTIKAKPSDPDAWQLLLQILFIEDRIFEAQQLGWEAYTCIRPDARLPLLRTLTLGLLTDLPDDQLRSMLQRWTDADPSDLDAQAALWQRIAFHPHVTDPDRSTILAAMQTRIANYPNHIGTREALVTALADAGEPDQGRTLLDTWPKELRDVRYWRLRGRWNLEYDHNPQAAVMAFRAVLVDLPQDWRSWYRLARALHVVGKDRESQRATEAVARIREILDPLTLEPRLDSVFDKIDNPNASRELASICTQAGLVHLADAWLTEGQYKSGPYK
jgi:tetratricopeptide (TPR) repeat protein